MNREQAHEKFDHLWSIESPPIDDIIDEIYDEVESKVCNNCQFWGTCNIKLDDGSYAYFNKTFGCNQFERKTHD